MSTAAVATTSKSPESSSGGADVQSFRETVESIVVAFILAFLFRAFVAEAFVIPTGSMAPTLMGAHKDIVCEFCGRQYQAGASKEFQQDSRRNPASPPQGFSFSQPLSDRATVASTCSICRGVNAYDLRGQPNHGTFSGDRILVSKFDYILSEPKRWDVFVFKYPAEARMNYIKRLVGLPGENLLIRDGDVYTKTPDRSNWELARKPPHKIKSMRRIVSDSDYLPPILIRQGWPSLWQPLTEQADGWQVQQAIDDEGGAQWSATLAKTGQTQWLRYYHKFVSEPEWLKLRSGGALDPTDPKQSQLITDYLAYNSSYLVSRGAVYERNGELQEDIVGEVMALDVAFDLADRNLLGIEVEDGANNDGYHWVGDLCSEFEIEVLSETGSVLLDLVEFGVHYTCEIDVATGKATLYATDGEEKPAIFAGATELTAETALKGSGSYRVEMANVDDQIVLWINGSVVRFSGSTTYDSYKFRSAMNRRPHWTENDPLDAAPLAIGGRNVELSVNRAAVYRDIYYIAVQDASGRVPYSDYDWWNSEELQAAVPDAAVRSSIEDSEEAVAAIYSNPRWWEDTNLFDLRGELRFDLEEGQYFPMGDNSAASSDARAWRGHHYVEQKFLLGKALLVFWPHTWNRPIPFTPNFSRMGRIR